MGTRVLCADGKRQLCADGKRKKVCAVIACCKIGDCCFDSNNARMTGHLSMTIQVAPDGAVDCSDSVEYEIILDTDFSVNHDGREAYSCGYFFGRTKFYPDGGDAAGNIDDAADLNGFTLAGTTFTIDGVAKGFNAASDLTPVVGSNGGKNCYALAVEIWRDKTFGGLTEGWRCRAILYVIQGTLDGTVTGNPPGTDGYKINAGALLVGSFNTDDLTAFDGPFEQPCGSLAVAGTAECIVPVSSASHMHDLGGGDGWANSFADLSASWDADLDATLDDSQCCLDDDDTCAESTPDEDGTCLIAP